MFRCLTVVMFLSFFAGCAHSNASKASAEPKAANPAEVEKVKKRAELDLNCSEVNVEVLEQGSMMRPLKVAGDYSAPVIRALWGQSGVMFAAGDDGWVLRLVESAP